MLSSHATAVSTFSQTDSIVQSFVTSFFSDKSRSINTDIPPIMLARAIVRKLRHHGGEIIATAEGGITVIT